MSWAGHVLLSMPALFLFLVLELSGHLEEEDEEETIQAKKRRALIVMGGRFDSRLSRLGMRVSDTAPPFCMRAKAFCTADLALSDHASLPTRKQRFQFSSDPQL